MALHANMPTISAAKNAAVRGMAISGFLLNSPLAISLAIFPNISGRTIRNENLAALERSIFSITAIEIVAPDLEIPGRMAIACATPIMNESRKLTGLSVLLDRSASNRSMAVNTRQIPINQIYLPNMDSI